MGTELGKHVDFSLGTVDEINIGIYKRTEIGYLIGS